MSDSSKENEARISDKELEKVFGGLRDRDCQHEWVKNDEFWEGKEVYQCRKCGAIKKAN